MSYQFSPELDHAKLDELYMGDPGIACEVFAAFVQETISLIPRLEESFQRNDRQEFRKLLHKLKPGFLYVGLTDIFERMSDAEKHCQAVDDLDSMEPALSELFSDIKARIPVVRRELEQLQRHGA